MSRKNLIRLQRTTTLLRYIIKEWVDKMEWNRYTHYVDVKIIKNTTHLKASFLHFLVLSLKSPHIRNERCQCVLIRALNM